MTEAERTKAIERFSMSCNDLLEHMRDAALKQFRHNLDVNVPNGMRVEIAPQQAITSAIVKTMSRRTGYDPTAAVNLAALIVEDVNLHELAKALREGDV